VRTKIIIGGVDEAFNVPFKRVCLRQPLLDKGLEVEWQDFGGGTGQIMRALNTNEIQAATVLTEGVVADIYRNNQARIFSSYVISPLEWGIHVHENSGIAHIEGIKDRVIAISKFGSGSHLMPVLNAYERGWDVNEIRFKEINNLAGGLNALTTGEADVFFWEKHTTRSYLKSNHLAYVDSFKGPWGAFVLAVNNKLTDHELDLLAQFYKLVLEEASNFKLSHLSAPSITRFNNMDLPTAQSWLHTTRFASTVGHNQLEVLKVQELLFRSGILVEETKEKTEFFV
jgi:hypothetical protein